MDIEIVQACRTGYHKGGSVFTAVSHDTRTIDRRLGYLQPRGTVGIGHPYGPSGLGKDQGFRHIAMGIQDVIAPQLALHFDTSRTRCDDARVQHILCLDGDLVQIRMVATDVEILIVVLAHIDVVGHLAGCLTGCRIKAIDGQIAGIVYTERISQTLLEDLPIIEILVIRQRSDRLPIGISFVGRITVGIQLFLGSSLPVLEEMDCRCVGIPFRLQVDPQAVVRSVGREIFAYTVTLCLGIGIIILSSIECIRCRLLQQAAALGDIVHIDRTDLELIAFGQFRSNLKDQAGCQASGFNDIFRMKIVSGLFQKNRTGEDKAAGIGILRFVDFHIASLQIILFRYVLQDGCILQIAEGIDAVGTRRQIEIDHGVVIDQMLIGGIDLIALCVEQHQIDIVNRLIQIIERLIILIPLCQNLLATHGTQLKGDHSLFDTALRQLLQSILLTSYQTRQHRPEKSPYYIICISFHLLSSLSCYENQGFCPGIIQAWRINSSSFLSRLFSPETEPVLYK